MLTGPDQRKAGRGPFHFMSCGMSMPSEHDEERDSFRGKRDAEILRDAEEVRSDSGRMKHAMRHLEHARAALESHENKRELRGKKRKGRREGTPR